MTYEYHLKKAIRSLKPLKDRDTIYADCLFHLESELRRLEEVPKPQPTDFLNHPSDGWTNDKTK